MIGQAAPPRCTSLYDFASDTPKVRPGDNEDAGIVLVAADGTACGVAVADGVGSHEKAGEAARMAVELSADWAKRTVRPSAEDLAELFVDIRRRLRRQVDSWPVPPRSLELVLGTTLLVAVETPVHIFAAYVGNGAILHLRGDFDSELACGRLPACAANYLRPHVVAQASRPDCLYNLISPSELLSRHAPTIIEVSKDPHFGDILVLCTDGIYTAEQALHGTDPDGNRWISADSRLTLLYKSLAAFCADHDETVSLRQRLQDYLQSLKQHGSLDDDATAGLIITGAAREHQQRRRSSGVAS